MYFIDSLRIGRFDRWWSALCQFCHRHSPSVRSIRQVHCHNRIGWRYFPPELATCVVAAAKKKGQLALGNVLGSNVFNILLILGCSAVVIPLDFSGMNLVDMGILLASVLLLMFGTFAGKKMQINRVEGALLLACEIGYLIWLFTNL